MNGTTLTSGLTYEVADESIATVNNGTITGVGEGTTTVTVSYNNAKSAIFVVNVVKYSLEVSKNLVSLSVGSTDSVTVSLNGTTLTSGLTYEVADESIATVNNGTITGVGEGTTTVTVSYNNAKSAIFVVNVVKYSLEVSKKLVSLSVGSTDSVTVSLNGANVTSDVNYEVADESVATVANGTITGVGPGSTTVTVSLDNVNSATFTVSVVKHSLEVSKKLVSLSVGSTDSVTVSLNGANVTSEVNYEVADQSIATVSNGTITGVGEGTTIVTVSLDNVNSVTFTVSVVKHSLEVSKNLISVSVGSTDSLTVSLNGANVTSNVNYEVADESIASVTNGTITGISKGITTVTVSYNNAKNAIFVVNVGVENALEVSKDVVTVGVSFTDSVTVSLNGTPVTSDVTYEVADESIARVVNGTITGVGEGITTVKVSSNNANSAIFVVNVVKYTLELSKNVVNVSVGTTDTVTVSLNGTPVTSDLTYEVADQSIATVVNGTVTGVGEGSTTVLVSHPNANSTTFEVNVVKYSLEVSKNVVNISVGDTDTVIISLNGEPVTNQVNYEVADESVATVVNGTVTGVGSGTTTVTVSMANVNSVTFEVNVSGNPFARAEVGDYVEMGTYPQTATGDVQPIEWQVLHIDEDNNRVLVVSRYILDQYVFNSSTTAIAKNGWKDSSIRPWLNNTFYNTAFSRKEKGYIASTEIATPSIVITYDEIITTTDKVFLLSGDSHGNGEANEYFADNTARQCAPTPYAALKCDSYQGYYWWWLRSPIRGDVNGVYCVYGAGSFSICGEPNSTGIGVRPALWIDLNVL